MAQLQELIAKYEEIRGRKEELEELTKENNAALDQIKKDIADQMVEDDTPSLTVGSYTYSLQNKSQFSFISAEKLAEKGLDKFNVLRENGLGYLITETVNQRTLTSAMNEMEVNGEIPDAVQDILSRYDTTDIARRKAPKSKILKKEA